MADERWNDDIAYVFSIHRTFMGIFGLWPLQRTVFTRIRCGISLMAQIMVLPYLVMDFTAASNHNAGASIESMLYVVSTTIAFIKCSSIALNQMKIDINVNAAIDDWLAAKDDEETWKTMKKYAPRARILSLVLLYSAVGCFILYILVIVMINLKQIFFADPNSTNANTTNWIFLVPSGSLGKSITGSQYAMILFVQVFQTGILCTSQCLVDCFFFSLAVHLASQLKVLEGKFQSFANEPYTVPSCRRRFVDLVNRHSELMRYFHNLEDTFHFLILCQLTVVTVMLSLLGLRLSFCLKENNQVEFMKSSLLVNYLLMQSLVYNYAGDFLQRASESIFHALYATSWFTLPLTLMKDVHFAMMRSSIPFRLTGGKFFYINRETMMSILNTALSYISVLRVAIED